MSYMCEIYNAQLSLVIKDPKIYIHTQISSVFPRK